MQTPDRRQRQSRRGFSENQDPQGIHERHVHLMQHEIDHVVARWIGTVAENRVIQQVGESSERPVQSRGVALFVVPIPSG